MAFVATHVHGRNCVGIGLAGGDGAIAIRRRFQQAGIQLDCGAVRFAAIDVVSGEIGVRDRGPDEIDEWLLPLA